MCPTFPYNRSDLITFIQKKKKNKEYNNKIHSRGRTGNLFLTNSAIAVFSPSFPPSSTVPAQDIKEEQIFLGLFFFLIYIFYGHA